MSLQQTTSSEPKTGQEQQQP